MNPDQHIKQQAIRWAALTSDPEFEGWDDFVAWLEKDPAHARAYDETQLAIDDAADAMEVSPAPADIDVELGANDNEASGFARGRWGWFGGAIAASLAILATFTLWPGPGDGTVYETMAGETLRIDLADGSTVDLGGASRLTVSAESNREASLDAGQALFTIRHDDSDPFILHVADERLVDAGTIFDVRMDASGFNLAVSEGAVIVNPGTTDLRADAGQQIVLDAGQYTRSQIDPEEVGEWSRGRITFHETGLAEIAAEMTRATGIPFESGAEGDGVRLSGSITLDQVRDDPQLLEAILGVSMRETPDGWVISAK